MSEKKGVVNRESEIINAAGIELHTGDLDLVLWAKNSKELKIVTQIYLQTFVKKAKRK